MTLTADSILPIAAPSRVARPRRMIQLDVLRGIAILMVLGAHAVVPSSTAGLFFFPARLAEHLGWTGVDLFFVLSGFLVGGLLMEELRLRGSLDIGRFIIRRAFKIWPAYYCLVIGCFIFDGVQTGWGTSFHWYLPNLLHVQNYFGVGPLGVTWSLAVEEHFYLLLPLLLYLLTARGTRPGAIRALPWIAGGVIVGCNALRLYNLRYPYTDHRDYFPTHIRIDGLAMGVLLAYFYHFRPEFLARIGVRRWTLIVAALVLLSTMAKVDRMTSRFAWTIGYTLLYVGYACILTAFIHTPCGSAGGALGRFFSSRAARVLAGIGLYSYSIYLWHLTMVAHPFRHLIPWLNLRLPATVYWLFWMSLYVGGAYVGGFILGRLIEMPALVVRDRLFPPRAGAMRGGDVIPPTFEPIPRS